MVRTAGIAVAAGLVLASTVADAAPRRVLGAPPSAAPPTEIARGAIAARPGPGALGPPRVVAGIVVFDQLDDGARVLGGGVAIRVDPDGRTRWIDDRRRALPALPAARLGRAAAEAIARAAVPGRVVAAELVVLAPPAGAPRRAWRIDLAPAGPPWPSAPRLTLDATTGEIVERQERAAAAIPTAEVWPVSPTATPDLARVELALPEGAAALATAAVVVEGCRDERVCLVTSLGARLHSCRRAARAAPDDAGDFAATPPADHGVADDDFAEVQAFHHVTTALATLEALAGGPVAAPLRVVVNYQPPDLSSLEACADGDYEGDTPLENFNNAYFTPIGEQLDADADGPALVFGQGNAVDFAYDGDVVAHELGHAVLAALAPDLSRGFVDRHGWNPTPAALHEGLPDLLAVAVHGGPLIGEYVGTGLGVGEPVRDLAEVARCPEDLRGRRHGDAQPLVGAIWRTRAALPASAQPALDAALLGAIAASDAYADNAAIGALLLAELEVRLGPAAAAALAAAFAETDALACGGFVLDGDRGVGRAIVPEGAPAPFQLRVEARTPVDAIVVDVEVLDDTSPENTDVRVLLRLDEPLTWRDDGDGPHAAIDAEIALAKTEGRRARAVLRGPFPPGIHHVTLENRGPQVVVANVTARTEGDATPGGCAAGGAGALAGLGVLALAARLRARAADRAARPRR